jgi:peptide/nickel transport system substrate-binding protein
MIRETTMVTGISRRALLGSAAIGLALKAWGQPALAAVSAERLIVAVTTEPRNLNPAIVASNSVFYVASKVIEQLAEADAEGLDGLRPLLATGWEGSEDGLSATFRLREGVTWHDGAPFTSRDVAFSAMEVWKPLQNIGRTLLGALEAVDTPDDYTAVFRFAEPTPFQLIRNALPVISHVLPAHLYEGTDIAASPYNNAPVGTGPFRFVEHRPGEYYRLTRNDAYWGDGPRVEELLFRVLQDSAAAAGALEAGEIALAAFSTVPLADLARIEDVPGLAVYDEGYEALTYQLVVEINHRNPILADPRVREAMSHAIDRDFVVDTVFLGFATASVGPVPRYDTQFLAEGLDVPAFDTERANALLDEAGHPRGADGTRFALRLLPAPWFNETRQFGAYLRQALAAVGIDVEIVSNDPPGHIRAVYTDHAFDLAVGSPVYRGDPAISTTNLVQSGLPAGVPFSNQGGFADASIDALIVAGRTTVDEAARVEIYKQFQNEVRAALPLINVAEWGFTTVASTALENVQNNPRWAVTGWADLGVDG